MNNYFYSHQIIEKDDVDDVINVLDSDYLTCGPKISQFEKALCEYTGARFCVVVANGTAALHLACAVMELEPGDEGITSPITFLASPNSLCYTGAKPVFADIDPRTANIDPSEIEKKITDHTRVLIPVHFAGQSCDMERIAAIAEKHGLKIIEDAAHAIGSHYKGKKVGSCAWSDMTVFSFHPVKNITTGEGGAITTNDPDLYERLLALRAHGMHKDGTMANDWRYEMRELGYNYRLTDIQAALGLSQLKKLEKFKKRRREIVNWYNKNLGLKHLEELPGSDACFHLYPVLVPNREEFYIKAREHGLHLQVHYIPVHLQPYYKRFGYKQGDYPKAEKYYEDCVSLPLYPALKDEDLENIKNIIQKILQ